MKLFKVEMGWHNCLPPKEVEYSFLRQGVGTTEARPNRYDSSMVYTETTDLLPEQVSAKYRQLQNVLRGCCRSLKLYYEAEGSGSLPYVKLKGLGFEPHDHFIWKLPNSDYSVAAIAIPHVDKEPFWVLQIEKRKGKAGVPVTACEMATLMPKDELVEVSLFDLEVS